MRLTIYKLRPKYYSLFFFCKLLFLVFRIKVLEGYRDALGENSEEEGEGSHCVEVACKTLKDNSMHKELDSVCHELEDKLECDALCVMKKHRDFMEKQTVMAERYKMISELSATVSSKRPIEDIPAGESKRNNGGKRTKTQAEKNRNRKIKKRKAKRKLYEWSHGVVSSSQTL